MKSKEYTKVIASKPFKKQFCNLTLTAAIKYHWELAGTAAPTDQEVEKHFGIWLEKKGKALLGFDGSALGLHYKDCTAAGRVLTLHLEGKGQEGSKLQVDLTLVSLKKDQGSCTAKVTSTFNTTTYEVVLANSGKLKLVINPQLKAAVDPNYAEIFKWVAESPAGQKAAKELGWMAGKGATVATGMKAVGLATEGLDLPVAALFKVGEIVGDLAVQNAKLADQIAFNPSSPAKTQVHSAAEGFWGAYEAGLIGVGARAPKDLWQRGKNRRERMIKEMQQKYPNASLKQCETGISQWVQKQSLNIHNAKRKDIETAVKHALWQSYYAKHKHEGLDVKFQMWIDINGQAKPFPPELQREGLKDLPSR